MVNVVRDYVLYAECRCHKWRGKKNAPFHMKRVKLSINIYENNNRPKINELKWPTTTIIHKATTIMVCTDRANAQTKNNSNSSNKKSTNKHKLCPWTTTSCVHLQCRWWSLFKWHMFYFIRTVHSLLSIISLTVCLCRCGKLSACARMYSYIVCYI